MTKTQKIVALCITHFLAYIAGACITSYCDARAVEREPPPPPPIITRYARVIVIGCDGQTMEVEAERGSLEALRNTIDVAIDAVKMKEQIDVVKQSN